jgi:hypothetical protein
MEVEAHMEQEA